MLKFRTGDNILFSKRTRISLNNFYDWHTYISLIIKLLTWCHISHMGVVIVIAGEVYLYESTLSHGELPCYDLGKANAGIQLVKLEDRINSYDGKVYVSHLQTSICDPKSPLNTFDYKNLDDLREKLKGRQFEISYFELFMANIKLPLWFRNKYPKFQRICDLSYIFCSESGAKTHMVLGVIEDFNNPISSDPRPPNKFTPKDFYARKLPMLKGYFTFPCRIK